MPGPTPAGSAFQVIPAIDVASGRLARIRSGAVVPVEAFDGDPVAAARDFLEAGATWAHVVDLDLAFHGWAGAAPVQRAVADLGLRVQASGGITSEREVVAALDAGAERVVLGSGALSDLQAVGVLAGRYGDRLVVGLEIEGDLVRPRGRAAGEWALALVLDELREAAAARFLVTAVGRVGGMVGPDLEAVARVARETGRPVVAAGGVGRPEDVAALAALDPAAEGAVVGRALYEGRALGEFLRAVPAGSGR
jgi:phosphoribosyl isomerase A